jgi:hypothetical protein
MLLQARLFADLGQTLRLVVQGTRFELVGEKRRVVACGATNAVGSSVRRTPPLFRAAGPRYDAARSRHGRAVQPRPVRGFDGKRKLSLSAEGLARLKQDEGVIDGLYDDPSGYCTSGVGHLVHQTDKWGCFLLQAASGDDEFKKSVLKQWPGKPYETPYLARGAAFVEKKFDDLKGKAADAAKEAIAQKRYKKSFDKLTQAEQDAVTEAAKGAVDEQAKALAKTTDATLVDDLIPFEKAARDDLAALEKPASAAQPGAPAAVSGPKPVSGPALVKP